MSKPATETPSVAGKRTSKRKASAVAAESTRNDAAPAKSCKYCQKPMPLQAIKCTECGSWQNWRGALNFSVPVLSLLLALVSVIFSSGYVFYQAVTYQPRLDLRLIRMNVDNTRQMWSPGDLRVAIVNNEDEDIIVNVGIECTAENLDKPTARLLFRASRLYSKPDDPILSQRPLETGDIFIIEGKTQEVAVFSTLYWEGNVKDVVPSSTARVHISCLLPYSYRGRRLMLRAEENPFIWVPPTPDPLSHR